MENSRYTIAPSRSQSYFQWILYLGILLVAAYLYLAYDIYKDAGWTTEAMINLLIGIVYSMAIYINLTADSPHDEVSFSEDGISISGNNEQKLVRWVALEKISITNNSLFLDFIDNRQEELNIAYLKYNQLQEAKNKVRSLCEQQQISFSSKY